MTISQARIQNAIDSIRLCGPSAYDSTRKMLEADDEWTMRHSSPAPRSEDTGEPTLPNHVEFVKPENHYYCIGFKWIHGDAKPDALRKIAEHIEWRSRSKPAAKGAEVSDEMVEAAYSAFCKGDADATINGTLRAAIQAALAAGKKETL